MGRFYFLLEVMMALDYAKQFYNSKAWRDLSQIIRETHHHICSECGDFGNEVHHIKEITPKNINDHDITLNEANLQLLCTECHNNKRRTLLNIEAGLKFNINGDLVKK